MEPDAASRPERLFVAVRLPSAATAAIRSLPRPDVPGVRWSGPDTWHVTLRFLGNADAAAVARALAGVDLGRRVAAWLGPATSLLGRNVLVVPAHGLDDLARRAVAATATLGRPPDRRPFAGHVTIARRRRGGRRPPDGVAIDVAFTATDVGLYSSTLHPDGARHDIVERFALG